MQGLVCQTYGKWSTCLIGNREEDENDTWVLFSDQYLDVVHIGNLLDRMSTS